MQDRQRILLVDDNERNLAILTKILKKDHTLETAADGSEALAMASLFEPDMVLLDIMMPGMDGYETCRRMRLMPELRYTKIIMVSARALLSERLEGYESGADDYITKPFDPEELAAKVRVYLRLKTAEEINQLKTTLLTMVGEETRAPLENLNEAVQDLRALGPDDPAHTSCYQRVETSSRRVGDVIEKVSTLGQMRTKAFDFDFETTQFGDLMDLASARVRELGCDATVEFDRTAHGAWQIRADRRWMSKSLALVLVRAARWCAGETVPVDIVEAKNAYHIRIAGPRESASEFWLAPTPNRDEDCPDGHLDLAIIKEVAEAHGGGIYLESSSGVSSTFVIQMPMLEATAEIVSV